MKQILFDAGLKSDQKMTIAACKRLKEKRDKAKEIAELDLTNIIDSGPNKRSTRRNAPQPTEKKSSSKKSYKTKLQESSGEESDAESSEAEPDAGFSRIKDLIESDESDTEKTKAKNTTKHTISDSE